MQKTKNHVAVSRLNRLVDHLRSKLEKRQYHEVLDISREWIFSNLYHATKDTVSSMDAFSKSFPELYLFLRSSKQGYWCAGFASMMTNLLTYIGIPAKTLAIGRTGLFTHAACLVKLDDGFFIHDPYHNVHYSQLRNAKERRARISFKEIVQGLRIGELLVPCYGSRVVKTLISGIDEDTSLYGYRLYASHKTCKDKKLELMHIPFNSIYSHPLWNQTEYRYRKDTTFFKHPLNSLFLDPLWISSMATGYNPNPFTDEWIQEIYSDRKG